ncbi:unnamed protein product, partial [Didymodactylos carnosus]
ASQQMDNSEDFINQPHQTINIQDALLTRLEEARQQFPERFSKSVQVLAAVDDTIDGEWEQRLRQTKEKLTEVCVMLIPYYLGDFHWIGVLIKYKMDGQIEWAEFIDPVKNSTFQPDKLQKQFTKIYPGVILKSKTFQKHNDQKLSARLTIENLLKAAEKAVLTEVHNPNTHYS